MSVLGLRLKTGVEDGGRRTLTSPAPWMMSFVFSIALSLEPSPLRGMLGWLVWVVSGVFWVLVGCGRSC